MGKRKNLNDTDDEPRTKRFKEDLQELSSSDNDDSYDSDDSSDFDFFSSSSSDSDVSSLGASSSDNLVSGSDTDLSLSQDDISIKDEPIYESEPEYEVDGDTTSLADNGGGLASGTDVPITIKTEVLDSIVDAVEVDSKTLLGPDVQVKEEPEDSTIVSVDIKEEPATNSSPGLT